MKSAGQLRTFVREVIEEAAWSPSGAPHVYNPPVPGAALAKGMKVEATYRGLNRGTDQVEILGVAVGNNGDDGVKFNSVKEAMKDAGVTSLRALEALDSYHLVVRELPYGDSGPWYYLFQGRWCRGSGAERLTFTRIQ
jgi:hypothetical protein